MRFFLKVIIVFFLLSVSFMYGVYKGTANNNYIHNKKRLLMNTKTIATKFLKRFDYNIDKINIVLSNKNSKSLESQIEKATENNIINKDSTSWLKAKIHVNNRISSGKVKIKGMFLDDFERKEKHFSYSVKQKNPFYELSQFYIHYPEKRLKLYEWYGDKLLQKTNLIYHKNYFANLSINNEKKGLHLIEEKSNKNLLKNNNRELGPIVYFSKKQLRDHNYDYIESYNNAKIKAQ